MLTIRVGLLTIGSNIVTKREISRVGRVLVGISSWQDKTILESGFYPQEINTPEDRLHYYARHFPLAELDSTFYAFPTSRNLDLWINSTPSDFIFDLKPFSLFTTHPTPLNAIPRAVREKFDDQIPQKPRLYMSNLSQKIADELWEGFAEAVEPLNSAGKLGAILFQFPPWFHPSPENFEYLSGCRERLKRHRIAVEFRTGKWLDDDHLSETLDFLKEHEVTLICVDEPQGLKSSVPPLAQATASLGLVRFHGRNLENWERKGIPSAERFKYLYSQEELKEWAPKVKQMAGETEELHLIFKNKYRDFSVKNAFMMKQLLGLQ